MYTSALYIICVPCQDCCPRWIGTITTSCFVPTGRIYLNH